MATKKKTTTSKKTATAAPKKRAASSSRPSRRAVVVAGSRTPFVKAFKEFMRMDSIALGVSAVGGLLERTQVPQSEIDAIVWGGVILPAMAPNVGREIALDLRLPYSVEGMIRKKCLLHTMPRCTIRVGQWLYWPKQSRAMAWVQKVSCKTPPTSKRNYHSQRSRRL